MTLYVFNPEHDYAQANNDPHFLAPASAIRFADECASFLRFLTEEEGVLFRPYHKEPFENLQTGSSISLPDSITRIRPWGWNPALCRQLRLTGIDDLLLPTPDQLERLRTLAHRKTSSEAMQFLHEQLSFGALLPPPALQITSTEEAKSFVSNYGNVIFKSPYSGNGRGHLYAHGNCSPTLQRQIGGVIRRQGAIMAEPMHTVVCDFAMEFRCSKGNVSFCGYSLFNTRGYGYAGNCLCSDETIERKLCEWIPLEQLHETREALTRFLQYKIAPEYDGYLGVDMFIYQKEGYQLNPMVEINLRMTMGMAAHILRERHIHPDSEGEFRLEYRPQEGALKALVMEAEEQHPPQEYDNRWYSGFHALTPVDDTTQYAFFVLLQPIHHP